MTEINIGAQLKEINKSLGSNLRRLGDEQDDLTIESVSSGSLAIDKATGRGGWPRGRIIEIYGPESGGKTTISLIAAAAVQKAGGKVCFIDAEHSLDPAWAAKLGVDVDNLYIEQPDSGDNALELICQTAQLFDMIIVDSVASLVPKAELEGNIGEGAMLQQAKMMSIGLRKVANQVGKSKCICIFINQTREKPVAMGDPETTAGGKALRFYASLRARVHKVSGTDKKEGSTIVGHDVRILFKKNKVAPPFTEAVVSLYFTKGIDPIEDIINAAASVNIFNQSGAFISFEDIRWKGWDAVREDLGAKPELRERLKQLVLSK